MREYNEPKVELVNVNYDDVIKTSPVNMLDEADKYAGSTTYTWN